MHLYLASTLFLLLPFHANATSTSPAASCEVRDAVAADSSVSYTTAIKGKTVKWGMESYFPPYVNLADNTGYTIDVVKELARRGEFTYSITDLGNPADGQSWDDFILEALKSEEYDLIGTYYTITPPRLASGWAFTYEYVEVSDMLLAKKPVPIEKDIFANMQTFVRPFSVWVWLVLATIVLGAGVIHWYADRDRREESRETWKQFVLRKLNLRKRKYHFMLNAINQVEEKQKRDKEQEERGGEGEGEETGRSRKSVNIQSSKDKDKDPRLEDLEAMANKLGWEEEAAIDYMDPLERPDANITRFPRIGASVFMKVSQLFE